VSLRTLLALIGCLAAAIAVIFWLGHRAAPGETVAPAAPLLAAFSDEALSEIELACGGTVVTLSREGPGAWRVTQPFEAEADLRRVQDLIASLRDARVKKVISDSAAHQDAYGLSPAACTVHLGFPLPAPAVTFRLGRSSPIGSDRYAGLDGARVVLTEGSLFGAVSRGAEAFREKRLFPVDPEEITRIVVDGPAGRLAVTQSGSAWRLEAPYADAASSSACSGLARAVGALELNDPGTVPAPIGTLPSRRLELEVTTSGRASPAIAFVAAAGIDGKRLAWRDGSERAGLVEESAARELDRPPESFRDPRIATFSSPDVRRLTIERGRAVLRLAREREGSPWSGADGSADFAVDGRRVEDLLDRIRALTASGFRSGAPPTQPTGTIAIEGGGAELARFTWGPAVDEAKDPAAGELWVTTPARPGVVFRMGAASLGPVPTQAADLAPTVPPTAPASGGS